MESSAVRYPIKDAVYVDPRTMRARRASVEQGKKALIHLLLVVLAVPFVFPFYWVVSSALQTTKEQFTLPLTWWPPHPQFQNITAALVAMPWGTFLAHTLLIVVLASFGAVASASLCAYGFARLRFWGRDIWFMVVLSTMMLPFIVTLIPVYIIMKDLGWLNTYYPLIVPAYFGGGAFNIFLIRQFMLGIPVEIEEAARVDGASRWTVFFRIVLPLLKPVIAVAAWFSMLGSWGDFLNPLIYLTTEKSWTFTLALYEFPTLTPPGWGSQLEMVMSIIGMLPIIVGFFFIQAWLIEGIQLGALVM